MRLAATGVMTSYNLVNGRPSTVNPDLNDVVRKWTDQSGVEKYSTEVVLQGFNSNLTMLDGRSGGGGGSFGSDDSGGDFGSGGPSGGAPRRAVAAGAGARNSDMDDDIPF